MPLQNRVATTPDFVIAKGFVQAGDFPALLGFDGTRRLFAELFADNDRPDVHPAEAYHKLLYSLQAGWTIRFLQLYWPDPKPRSAFLQGLAGWKNHSTEGLDIFYDGLSLAVEQLPLPSLRRTFIEFVLPGNEGLAWWEGLAGLCALYGLHVKYLDAGEIQELAYRVFNPDFDQPNGSFFVGGEYKQTVAPAGVEVKENYLEFPETVLVPISARGGGVPGMPDRPWTRVGTDLFISHLPTIYSLTIRCEPPDTMRTGLRARRTLSEGFLAALSMKVGRRPSMAESAQDTAMDAAESQLALGKPIFRVLLLSAYVADRELVQEALNARKEIEGHLRSAGLLPQKLHFIPERALFHLQPGGNLVPGFTDEPRLFFEEFLNLLPPPSRRVMPVKDSIWLGSHTIDKRDVYFSYATGLDPASILPPHALTLILGESGSGKTTLLRIILLQRLMQGRTILSIDPEGENDTLCRTVGGKVVPAGIPDDPDTCLLHPLQAQTPQDMLLAVRFLLASLMGPEAMTPGIQAVLHEAVKRRWDHRPGNMSIADLVDTLGTLNDTNANTPVSILRPYMRGGLWEGFFDRPKALLGTEVVPGEWTNFNFSTLQDATKGIIHSVLSWFMYHIVTVGKTPMDIYIDEGWQLLRSGPFADLLDELGRRARKRDIGVTLVTHFPKDFARNANSLKNASTSFIGRTDASEGLPFLLSMGVSETEARRYADRINRYSTSEFLAVPSASRGALLPIRVKIPPAWGEFWKRLGIMQERRLEQ